MKRHDPESIDLAVLARHLRTVLGSSVPGAVVGRTVLRDEVLRRLDCSQLEAELLIDTMVGRAFLVLEHDAETGEERWLIEP
jgi:hypothetical protein